jgi:hypothetical protein
MVNQLESSISAQADLLYTLLYKTLGKYTGGLQDLGYELIEGGSELEEDWSLYCHPHYVPVIHILNLDLGLITEDDFIEALNQYYGFNDNKLPLNMLLPNPKSVTFQGWRLVSDLD